MSDPPGQLTPTIMRRNHSMSPFDVEADEADDVTQQFWGTSRGWDSQPHPNVNGGNDVDGSDELWGDGTTGTLRVLRQGVRAFRPQRNLRTDHSGQVARTRQHGVVEHRQAPAPLRPATREASLGELASGWNDDRFDGASAGGQPTQRFAAFDADRELVPLSPVQPLVDRLGVGAVDPLLARIGMLIVVALLLVPIALAMRPSSDQTLTGTLAAGVVPDAVTPGQESGSLVSEPPTSQIVASPSVAPVDARSVDPAPTALPASSPRSANEAPAAAPVNEVTVPSADVGDTMQSAAPSVAEAATVSAVAERSMPACPATYVAGAGDSWYRIADAAGVTPNALLDENRATVHTVIFPGDDICLPAGATMPTQPTSTTLEPTTTQAPATTAPASTAPATTQPPTTTPATAGEVQQIIRDVWPDDLEDKALQIAWRESHYIPTAYNGSCCYGIFQIYWSAHVRWLDEYGIYSSSDLLDARKNITAAYALYQRAGGWSPWSG